jgi:LysM domain
LKNFVRDFEERRFYQVRKGDTLTSIAVRMLGSARYVPLLTELNRDSIKRSADGGIKLVVGSHILLPSRADLMRFVSAGDDANVIYLESVSEQSEDFQPKYACRFGDNLKSIARRHPAMRDARLWTLLATINNLSDRQTKNKMPCEKLQRGQVLIIPSARQRLEFLQELPSSTVPKPIRGSIFGNGAECWPPRPQDGTTITGQASGEKKLVAGRPWIQEAGSINQSQPADSEGDTKVTGAQSSDTKPVAGKPWIQPASSSNSSNSSELAGLQSDTRVTGELSGEKKPAAGKPWIQEARKKI